MVSQEDTMTQDQFEWSGIMRNLNVLRSAVQAKNSDSHVLNSACCQEDG
jgi:hypothetical protein